MPMLVVNWIMAYVSYANFVVLVNGDPSSFFKSGGGIRQGFPLSPLLFLLNIEGLRKLILDAKYKGKVKGVNLSKLSSITHMLFVDDVLLFVLATVDEWRCYN